MHKWKDIVLQVRYGFRLEWSLKLVWIKVLFWTLSSYWKSLKKDSNDAFCYLGFSLRKSHYLDAILNFLTSLKISLGFWNLGKFLANVSMTVFRLFQICKTNYVLNIKTVGFGNIWMARSLATGFYDFMRSEGAF